MAGPPLLRVFAAGATGAGALAAIRQFQYLFPDAAIVTRAEEDLNIRCTTRVVFSIGTHIPSIARNLGRLLALHDRMLLIVQHPDEILTDAALSAMARSRAFYDDRNANELAKLITAGDWTTALKFLRDQCSIDCTWTAMERMFSLSRLERILQGCPHTNLRLEDCRLNPRAFVASVFPKHPELATLSNAPLAEQQLTPPAFLPWNACDTHSRTDEAVVDRYCDVFGYELDSSKGKQDRAGGELALRRVLDAIRPASDLQAGEPPRSISAVLESLRSHGGREETWRLLDDPETQADPEPLFESIRRDVQSR